MPTVNIYAATATLGNDVAEISDDLATTIATSLSTSGGLLDGAHVSLRVFIPNRSFMIAPIELEITAHAFPERVERQDEICGELRAWLERRLASECRVWLSLNQLGYGYKAVSG